MISKRVALQYVALCAVLLLLASCARTSPKAAVISHAEEVGRWKAERLASLKSEEGWLSLVGLYWLKEGENKLGSDPASDLALPAGKSPSYAGSLWLSDGAVRLEARPDAGITHEGKAVSTLDLQSDADGKPTVLALGTLRFNVVKRGERLGLRVKDRENPARAGFKGLEYFPLSDKWRVVARFERFDPPKSLPITNVLGMEEGTPSPGAVVFDVDGKSYRLDALSEKGVEQLFIIFADATSGRETYGAGRYLYADPPDAAGRIVVDFNKAYSPPCAFTNYATCPLPPFQNRLPIAVEAGEKFAGH
ncbi:MAG TPA: DUF1684 domain-containing protein [Pyrinomonadaceae bacterium]|nr:DUF1684 domain-containing protein [Pyrinomonadaceae bacterium]